MDIFQDPLNIVDRYRQPTTALRDMLAGRPSFLVCGGPSANQLDLNQLKQRGIFSLAVNNMAGKFWSNAFVCSDPPSKFHNGIWQDPTMMKFVPIPKLSGGRARLRERLPNGNFANMERNGKEFLTTDCPNVWGFGRRAWLQPDDTFFTDPDAAWGNHDAGVRRTGEEKTVNTTLLAIRLLYYLGSRKIFLVGCDWHMKPTTDLSANYAFGEDRKANAIKTNNGQYRVSGDWLRRMQNNGVFNKFGLEIYNCFQYSRLRAFSYVPFDVAVKHTLSGFPQEPFVLQGWYAKPGDKDDEVKT